MLGPASRGGYRPGELLRPVRSDDFAHQLPGQGQRDLLPGRRARTDRRRRLVVDVFAVQLGEAAVKIIVDQRDRQIGRTGNDTDADDPGLTGREVEVLRLVAAGQSNREIAAALVISPKTASVHVSNILAKLGTATRTEAAVKAHQLGLIGLLSR